MKHKLFRNRFGSTPAAALLLGIAVIPAYAEQDCLKKAWNEYNNKNYLGAITAADDCIDDFGPKATKQQNQLSAEKVNDPPTGAVQSGADKQRIFERWAVNDVATAYFVKGRSAEYLYKKQKAVKYKEMAQQAYDGAIKLSYGRCFDPQGFFWSPAEAAQERLEALKQ
jgi:hypothetical protein